MGVVSRVFKKVQRIEYARRQALDAYARAAECIDNRARDEWLKAAAMWEEIGHQYELFAKMSEAERIESGPA
ncbi:MAG: hypothetical protein ACREHV_15140 [Rhizomicrobium sp.]